MAEEQTNTDDWEGHDIKDVLTRYQDDLKALRTRISERDPNLLKETHTDLWLVRFLVHSTVDKATERVHDMLIWRRENEVDDIAERVRGDIDFTHFPHYQTINECIPMELIFGFTTAGSPFAVERWGSSDPTRLLELVRPDQYMEFCLFKFEFMRMKLDEACLKTGKYLSWCAIMDVAGANMKQCNKTFVDMLRRVAKTTELHYRELIGKVFVVNANRVFTFLWGVVKNFLPARTLNKISISKDPIKSLHGHIVPEAVPNYLGGGGPERCPPQIRCPPTPHQEEHPHDTATSSSYNNNNNNSASSPTLLANCDPQFALSGVIRSLEKGVIDTLKNVRLPRLTISPDGTKTENVVDRSTCDVSSPDSRLRHFAAFSPAKLRQVLTVDAYRRSFTTPQAPIKEHDGRIEASSSVEDLPSIDMDSDSDQNPTPSPEEVFCGWLQKRNDKKNKWSKRFFRLYLGELAYYRKEKHTRPIRVLSLYGYEARVQNAANHSSSSSSSSMGSGAQGTSSGKGPFVFTIVDKATPSNFVVLVLQAPAADKMNQWIDALNKNCQYISSSARHFLNPVMSNELSDSDHDSVIDDSEVIDIKKARRASIHRMEVVPANETKPMRKCATSGSMLAGAESESSVGSNSNSVPNRVVPPMLSSLAFQIPLPKKSKLFGMRSKSMKHGPKNTRRTTTLSGDHVIHEQSSGVMMRARGGSHSDVENRHSLENAIGMATRLGSGLG